MKMIFLLLMFGASSLSGLYYGYMLGARENTLKEMSAFFKYLVIRISTKSGKLYEFVEKYEGGKYIDEFLIRLSDTLKRGGAFPFEKAADCLFMLNEEDISVIRSMGIGLADYDEQIKALENAICYFDSEVNRLKTTDRQRHIVSYSGVLAGLALVIIFI